MSSENRFSDPVAVGPEARLSTCHAGDLTALEDLDIDVSRAVAPDRHRPGHGFVNDLKLLFAALGAGGRVVPLGDNGRTTRLLSEYVAALRDR
jgi:hypothetical protein